VNKWIVSEVVEHVALTENDLDARPRLRLKGALNKSAS
jgi:hypothetical protein